MATFGTSNKYINYSVNSQELSWDINSNTSVVRVWIDVWRTNTGYTTYGSGTVYARINGGLFSAALTSNHKITSTAIRIFQQDVSIGHEADGSKSISITGWISHSQFSSSEQGYSHTLTTIPRTSGFSISYDGYIGNNMTINISRASNAFTHEIYHDFVAGSWTSVASGVATSHTFTTPTSWLNRIPNSTQSSGRIRVVTKNGGSTIGESIQNFNAKAKDSVVPTFTSVTATAINPFGSYYLQGKSSVKLTINGASGVSGSTISSYSIAGTTQDSASKNIFTSGILTSSGDIKFDAVVMDSRGRSATKSVTISVKEYSPPSLSLVAYRSTSGKVRDDISGTYITMMPTFTFSNNGIGNSIKTKSMKINNVATSESTTFASGVSYIRGTYSVNSTHIVECSITDAVGNTVTASETIKVGMVPFNMKPNKRGSAFGTYATHDDTLEVGYDLRVDGEFYIQDKLQPVFTVIEEWPE